ncbi:hypothetical protein [Snodgrassella communis]|uniref:hypothetical protein n=1 Tax=Snodgrassella communis TaxID=2946699 RepID=UPI001EF5E043|nr:hypothetical protein [Snodgrassella communis]
MDIISIIKFLILIFSLSCIREFFLQQFIPSEDDMKKIAEYLVTTRKELNDKNASLKERKLALMSVPYLKYLDLSQIDFWEENYSNDIELLFNLYVAQGVHHKGIRRVIWNKNDLNYDYYDPFSLKNKSKQNKSQLRRLMNSTARPIIFIFILAILLLLMLFILSSGIGSAIFSYAFGTMIGIDLIFISLILYRNRIVMDATEKINNQYPDLIKGLNLEEQK